MGIPTELAQKAQWYTKPKYPSFMEKAQQITNLWTNPCNVPRLVYIETALPALGIALLEYMDFGVMDIVRGFTKPKALARGRHGSKRHRARGRKLAIPDLGDEIGKKLRPDAIHNRPISNGQLHLWKLYGRIEHMLWWWLVIDIAYNFGYNWASAIMAEEYCKKANEIGGAWEADQQTHATGLPAIGISGGRQLYHNPPRPFTGNWAISVPAGYTGTAILAASVVPANPANPPQNPHLAYLITDASGSRFGSPSQGVGQQDGDHHVVKQTFPSGAVLAPHTMKDGGGTATFRNVTQVYWATPIGS